MIRRVLVLTCVAASLAACDDDETGTGVGACGTASLPLSGDADGPTVTDVGLEVQASGIIVVATASDPQGSDNMRNVLQSVGVFPDDTCQGAPVVLQDDLAYSGVEETFGTAVDAQGDPDLYNAIKTAPNWPEEVTFKDLDGNRVSGRVKARIIR
jgi:hypothetical protein